MSTKKWPLNLIFAAIVVLLALTATITVYKRLNDRTPSPSRIAAPARGPAAEDASATASTEQLSRLERLAAEQPDNPDIQTQLANLHYDLGQFEKAAVYYERSLKLRPENPNVETDLATCYHYLGENDRSLGLLDNVLSYQPGFSQAKFNKGIVLINGKKDIQRAISVWEELLNSDPAYPHREELRQRIRNLRESSR